MCEAGLRFRLKLDHIIEQPTRFQPSFVVHLPRLHSKIRRGCEARSEFSEAHRDAAS
jgi:hypothetical protein